MKRLIPPSTKTRTKIVRDLTWVDLFVIALCGGLMVLFMNSPLGVGKIIGVLGSAALAIILVSKFGTLRGYQFFLHLLTFWIKKKKIVDSSLKEDCDVNFSKGIVSSMGVKSKIIEIHGIDFEIIPERKQDQIIRRLGQIYKDVRKGSIVKLDKPIDFMPYIKQNREKLEKWLKIADEREEECAKKGEEIPDSEIIGLSSRMEVLDNVIDTLMYNQNQSKQLVATFYLIIYDISEDELAYVANKCMEYLNNNDIDSHVLDEDGTKEFYELFFDKQLDENDDFVLPEIEEKFNKLIIDGERYRISSIDRIDALFCANAWLSQVFRLKGTKVVMNFNIEANKQKIYKSINRTITELRGNYADKNTREDEKIDIAMQIDGIQLLLDELKMDAESLHSVSLFILYPDEERKEIEEVFKDIHVYPDSLLFRQFQAYLSMLPYTYSLGNVPAAKKQWQTATLSATFPFVTKAFFDPEGDYLGASNHHVFFDQFYAWKHKGGRRTSSNMVILGKTGGGKSYFMKKCIMQHLCNGVRMFILDPENEYDYISTVFGGNIIDVGGVGSGIINPLQVFPTLKPDEDENNNNTGDEAAFGEVSSHRQFLQEFFGIICPKLENRCFTFLDEAIGSLYSKFNIDDFSNIEEMKPDEFPVLEDLYNLVDEWTENELANDKAIEYNKTSLVILRNNLKSFKKGGVHARLWNGHTSLKLENDLTVLNFQSLFSANNSTVANAQMLLVMRYLQQEVVKNYNDTKLYGKEKNMVIAVDEAHMFINRKFPVALDFMAQMVKRIRKYGGAMIVTTQNIGDFIGHSEETKVQATAVINGSQYSMVFGLNPNDVNNLIDLYSQYQGGLNQKEIDLLSDATQGQALFLVDSATRMSIKINLLDGEEEYILRPKVSSEEEKVMDVEHDFNN